MVKEHVSFVMDIDTKEILNMDFSMERANLAGQMEQFIEVNSKAMKLLEMDVINGQMDRHMRDKSKMV